MKPYISEFHSMVREMMNDYGSTATYSTATDEVDGQYDPATGEFTASRHDISVRAIIMDLTLQSNGDKVKEGTMIRAGDKLVYLEPTGDLSPLLTGSLKVDVSDDFLTISGIKYKVVTMKAVDPTGSDPLLFELYVRR